MTVKTYNVHGVQNGYKILKDGKFYYEPLDPKSEGIAEGLAMMDKPEAGDICSCGHHC